MIIGSWTHGTLKCYQELRCRCERCKAANRDYMAGWRDRVRGSLARRDPRHGTWNGYTNYRCKCARCVDAGRAYLRERLRRSQ